MDEQRNLAWHRAQVARIVNYQDGTPDQDAAGPSNDTWQKIDDVLNEAAREERNEAILKGSTEAFRKRQRFTWESGETTYALPVFIDRESILDIHDVTANDVGQPVMALGRSFNRQIFWLDNRTLQWSTSGPGQDTTLEISYTAEAPTLKEPAAEYDLFPYNHRDLLNWSAACLWADMVDQRVPDAWERRRNNYRELFRLAISRGSPTTHGAQRIRNHRVTR